LEVIWATGLLLTILVVRVVTLCASIHLNALRETIGDCRKMVAGLTCYYKVAGEGCIQFRLVRNGSSLQQTLRVTLKGVQLYARSASRGVSAL
jgi:hypothetical protein